LTFKDDNVGKYFGERLALSLSKIDDEGRKYYNTICKCGKKQTVRLDSLKKTKSCGCLNSRDVIRRNLYNRWYKIIDRCYNRENISFNNYGGRGIKVCDAWRNSFESFYNWSLENGYNPNLTIDRINNDGNYNPENCRWVDLYVQANNKRNNVFIEYNNKKYTFKEAGKILNMDENSVRSRKKRGWSDEKIMTTPRTDNEIYLTYNGDKKSISDWSKYTGLPKYIIHYRLEKGWNVKDILNKSTKDREIKLTYNDKTKTISEWAVELKVSKDKLYKRYLRGWDSKDIIEKN